MKRKLFLLVLLIGSSITSELQAQTVEGDWYTPLRNKLKLVTISKDSILFRKCSFDSLRDYAYVDMAFKIERKIKTTYIVSSVKDTIPTYYLFSFIPDHAVDKNYMNIESFTSKYPTPGDAEKAITEFENNPLKITFLTQKEIDKIRKKQALSSMSTTDFKKFAAKIMQVDSMNAQYAQKKYAFAYLYSESSTRLLLAELGFNTLVKGDQFDAMFDTFYENLETQQILIKMGTKPK